MSGWQTHGNPPEGLRVREIQVRGRPAFLFQLDEPVAEGAEFSLRFTWGAMVPLGTTTLTFPAGSFSITWALPERLIEDRRWVEQMRACGGERWFGKVSHPHYLPKEPGRAERAEQ